MPDEMRDYLEQRERDLEARVAALERALIDLVEAVESGDADAINRAMHAARKARR